MMKSIANTNIELVTKHGETTKQFTINNISIYDEFDIDEYYHLFTRNIENEKYKDYIVYDFIKEILGTKEELIKFAEFGKRVVVEFNDAPLLDIIVNFYSIIMELFIYRLQLKKK